MSDKDLQRVTESLSYIGQASDAPRRHPQLKRNHRRRPLDLTTDTRHAPRV